MKTNLQQVALRQKAIFIPNELVKNSTSKMNETTSVLVANATKLGFGFSEKALHAINGMRPTYKIEILDLLKDVSGVNKNWTPLVKGWNIPTCESRMDHVLTFFTTIFQNRKGTTLACGHTIPDGTFALERYNGCPYCGTPFEFGKLELDGKTNKLKVLDLWTETELHNYYTSLLQSKTALDATQIDSLKKLLSKFDAPTGSSIAMKETLMVIIDAFKENDQIEEAGKLFTNPTDILRYLWYKHTGFLQIIEPKTIVQRTIKNNHNLGWGTNLDKNSGLFALETKAGLKLKYTRKECKMVAYWLNELKLPVENSCEIMHPKRGMWIRFIRALRLAEYSKRKGFENLAKLLDVFYNENYTVAQGQIETSRLKYDADTAFALLKKRPGLFARSLFANMLWFGTDETLTHFNQILDKVPARLLFTLNSYKDIYFAKNGSRSVKPLGGTNKRISTNKLLNLYNQKQLDAIKLKIEELTISAMQKRFAAEKNKNKTIYIDKTLYNIPVAIGDRAETIQDLPSALMGTRFDIIGDTVRIFMQWGVGLPAQHLDMDLSCMVAYESITKFCSYSQLAITGCKHSGDIQQIPAQIGTAEYIDIDLAELKQRKAKYVSFTCNAYTSGAIIPNLVVGWMNSKYPMKISSKTGVAYNPADVQHQVRITKTASKGLVFGVLDVEASQIIWLEMAFGGRLVQRLDIAGVESLLAKLDSKLNTGYLLELKAKAQGLKIVTDPNLADESYDSKWAMDSAAVSQLLID